MSGTIFDAPLFAALERLLLPGMGVGRPCPCAAWRHADLEAVAVDAELDGDVLLAWSTRLHMSACDSYSGRYDQLLLRREASMSRSLCGYFGDPIEHWRVATDVDFRTALQAFDEFHSDRRTCTTRNSGGRRSQRVPLRRVLTLLTFYQGVFVDGTRLRVRGG